MKELTRMLAVGLLSAGLAAPVAAQVYDGYDYGYGENGFDTEEPADLEWEAGEGYHEEEWYDPSDWFDDDDGVAYEYETDWDAGYDDGVFGYGGTYDGGYLVDEYGYYSPGYDYDTDEVWFEGWYADDDWF